MAGSIRSSFRTTEAVLRPTPGRACSAARSIGTSPPYCSTRMRLSAMTFFALVLKRPMDEMNGFNPSSPSASIAAGVSAAWNSLAVALFTDTSVAWADSATDTTSV